jgi:hypothetical protein
MRIAACLLAACAFHPHGEPSDAPIAPGGDAPIAPGDAGEIVPACATPGSFADDFAGTQVGSSWAVVTQSASLAVANSTLTAMVNDNNSTSGALLFGKHVVDVTGGAMTIRVGSVLPGTGETSVYFERDAEHGVVMTAAKAELTTSLYDGSDAAATTKQLAYDGSQQFWRVREQAGTLFVEISADQVTWTAALDPIATPAFATTLRFGIVASGGMGSATFAQVDTASAPAPWCAIAQLHDTFPVGDTLWDNFQPQPPNAVVSGFPAAPPPPVCAFSFANLASVTDRGPATTLCYLATGYAWDLTNASATIAWGGADVSANVAPFVAIAGDNNAFFELYATNTNVCLDDNNAVSCISYAFDPSGQDATWTVSESAGMMSFANATTTLFTKPEPFAPAETELRLGIYSTTDQTMTTVTSTFDSVN